MIIAVGNTKGGVGKTTVAINIAVGLSAAGTKDVWLVDGDPQGTTHAAMAVRAQNDVTPVLACSAYTDGKLLRTQVQQQASKYDHVVIDVGGRDNSTLRAALVVADVLLVPFTPRSFDVWALNDVSELVGEVRAVRDGLQVLAVLNMADTGYNSADNRDAATAAQGVAELDYLDAPLCRRKAFANAAGEGRSVLEFAPIDYKARGELKELVAKLTIAADTPV